MEALDEIKVNMKHDLLNIIFNSFLNFLPQISWKIKRGAVEAVSYCCIRGFYGRIPDCKLWMHAKCFHDIQKSIVLDPCSRQSTGNNGLVRCKSCCHHSLKDLCLITDSACWKKKKYSHQKDIGYYPDGCIICLKSFSVGCVLPVKKGNDCMVCSICCAIFINSWIFILNCLFFSNQVIQASCFM